MKKLLILLVAIACALSLFACGAEHEHDLSNGYCSDESIHWQTCNGCDVKQNQASHTFGEPVTVKEPTAAAEGEQKVTCTVCGYAKTSSIPKLDHTHSYSSDWTSDAQSHWHACDGCTVKKDEAQHTWDDGEITKNPSSTSTGTMKYTCTVCSKTKTEPIEALPEKMSADAWIAAFAFENVRVDNESSYEFMGTKVETDGYCIIDGDMVYIVYVDSEGETESYGTRDDIMSSIDFSLYYDFFNHMGDDVYYAESVTSVVSDGTAEYDMVMTDVTVTFVDGVVASISYDYDMEGWIFGTELYTFSEYGEQTVELPTVTDAQIKAAISSENFDNYTVDYLIYVDDTNYTDVYYYVDGGKYYYESYSSDDTTDSGVIEGEGVGFELVGDVVAILAQLTAEDFYYDSDYACFISEATVEIVVDDATVSVIATYFEIDDGRLVYFGYVTEDYTAYEYYLYDYGITEIPTEE